MYFPPADAHLRQPRNEPLAYLTRARRVNIPYEGHDGQPYLGFMSRFLPELPPEIRRRITGYYTRHTPPQRVQGVTREDLWRFNRKHGRTAFLVPINAMRDEANRLWDILDRPYSQEHLDLWRQEFQTARNDLNNLLHRLDNITDEANASLYPAGQFHVFRAKLDEDKSDARERLDAIYNRVQLLASDWNYLSGTMSDRYLPGL